MSRDVMIQNKNSKYKCELMHIHESEIFEKLQDMIKEYKAKRNLLERKLKVDNDPRRYEFYTLITRLSMLDIIIMDLETVFSLLTETPSGKDFLP